MKNTICLAMLMVVLFSACGTAPTAGPDSTTLSPPASPSQAIPGEAEQPQPTLLPAEDPQLDPQGPYLQIQTALRSDPPCGGDKETRKDAILALDAYLKDDASRYSPEMSALYGNMMGFVEAELAEPVTSGVRIWSMYNHGFIVKTPGTVFAFDLLHGYPSWGYRIPDAILEQVQVLFISHKHIDHRDPEIISAITDFGGTVVAPAEDRLIGDNLAWLAADEELALAGLHIKAYDGLHGSTATRVYVITTPEGLTLMHTGDNQTSETLPAGVTVDILLLNAWVNESGSASAAEGMRNSIDKLNPKLTIPGHMQEMNHYYDPADFKSRLSFEAPLEVDDGSVPGEVSVQVWGEHCDFPTD